MADDSEQELLLESRESDKSEKSTVDEGLIVQLSKRDSASIITRSSKRTGSTNTDSVRKCGYMCTSLELRLSFMWG